MNTATRQFDLPLVNPSPWTGARLKALLVPRLSWRRIAGHASLLLALASLAIMVVALRMSLYAQSTVPVSITLPVTLGAALAGVLFLIGMQRLGEKS